MKMFRQKKTKTREIKEYNPNSDPVANYYKMMNQCSGTIKKRNSVTNRQLCEMLDGTHDKLYKLFFMAHPSRIEEVEPYVSEIKIVLKEMYKLISNSFDVNYRDGHPDFLWKDAEFIRPISARQADRAEAVLGLLKEQHFIEAFHELYDTIDDNGTQYKKWDNRYKTVSCNELVLFKCLITSFNTALDIAYDKNKEIIQ